MGQREGREEGKESECHCEIGAASGLETRERTFQFLTFGYTSMSATKGVQSREDVKWFQRKEREREIRRFTHHKCLHHTSQPPQPAPGSPSLIEKDEWED